MRVRIDEELCFGHGRCYSLAPDVFDANDEGRGCVRFSEIPPDLEEAASKAAEACPERAIVVER